MNNAKDLKFDKQVEKDQIAWRLKQVKAGVMSAKQGYQNKKPYDHILPTRLWTQGLWTDIQNSLPAYLAPQSDRPSIQRHPGSHNLKSSWTLCANLYFTFGQRENGRKVLTGFLKNHVSKSIAKVRSVELEFADAKYPPSDLLGEPVGKRGSGQTSPDVAFILEMDGGDRGIVLTENKFVEHSFYPCSGAKTKNGNMNPGLCKQFKSVLSNWKSNCWQANWQEGERKNRTYWDHIHFSETAISTLCQCPAVSAGCQLFRQQALAEALAATPEYAFVMSCVAWDNRNETLRHCLRNSGVEDFTTGWSSLFVGKAGFTTWSHQQWVSWVRDQHDPEWEPWLKYVEERYGY
jgi:hypothetical protein